MSGVRGSGLPMFTTSAPASDAPGEVVRLAGTVVPSVGTAAGTPAYVRSPGGDTAVRSSVNDNAASTSLLAANASRKRFIIVNDSSAKLYVGYGASAVTTTDYSIPIAAGGSYVSDEYEYSGELRGIWASDPNDGGARVTEIT